MPEESTNLYRGWYNNQLQILASKFGRNDLPKQRNIISFL